MRPEAAPNKVWAIISAGDPLLTFAHAYARGKTSGYSAEPGL